jgi:GNAT superfamily N-acetyltransferase
VNIREGLPGDGAALTRIHRENSAYYHGLAPGLFRLPEERGLVEFLDPVAEDNSETSLLLVAELEGEIAGFVYAELLAADESAPFQSPVELSELRLFINAVGASRSHWRRGIATALVEAAEAWGRERGATVALCDTWPESPVSLPFWERRMGYEQRSVRMRKRLD